MTKGIWSRTATAAAVVGLLAAGPAWSQGLPSVDEVATELDLSCLTAPLNAAICLDAVQAAIGTAAGYATIPQVPPQVDIGFLICAVMVSEPQLAPEIVVLIDQSANSLLALGCSNALPIDWNGPRPIISPA